MMIEPFFLRAAAACLTIALLAGPLGVLMVWKKTAYFGETLSHGALTGVVLGVICGASANAGVTVFVCLSAYALFKMSHSRLIETDLLLLIISQTALCAGWILLSLFDTIRSDLTAYLFGDVLAVSNADLIFMGVVSCLCAVLLKKNWKKQIFVAVSPEIAQSEGVDVLKQSFLFMMITALFVSVAFKTTGALLAAALLVIPPCAAFFYADTPEKNALLASVIGVFCVTAGLFSSAFFDVPAAPAMEICCAVVFFGAFLSKSWHNSKRD